jgi:insulysin
MHEQWLKSGQLLIFVTGNLKKSQAVDLFDQIRSTLNIATVTKESFTQVNCAVLPIGEQVLEFDVEDRSNANSALLSYFQLGVEGEDMRSKLLNELCWQYLEEPTFDQLRTTE